MCVSINVYRYCVQVFDFVCVSVLCTHIHRHAHTHMHTRTHAHTHTRTHTHTHTHTHTRTHTHSQTHTHIYAYTHTHTYTCKLLKTLSLYTYIHTSPALPPLSLAQALPPLPLAHHNLEVREERNRPQTPRKLHHSLSFSFSLSFSLSIYISLTHTTHFTSTGREN